MKKRFVIFKNSENENFVVNTSEIRTIVQKEEGTIVELHLKNRAGNSNHSSVTIRLNNTLSEVIATLSSARLL